MEGAMTNIIKPRFRFGSFEVDLQTQELWKNGVKLKLGGQPFAILAALLEQPGLLISREELRTKIWSEDTFVDFNHGLNAAVNKLREVLNDSVEHPRYIETLPRRGYRFIASLDVPVAAPAQPTTLAEAPPACTESKLLTVSVRPRTRRFVWAFMAASLLASFVLLGSVFDRYAPEARERQAKALKERGILGGPAALRAPSIWHMDLTRPNDPHGRAIVTSAKDRTEDAQLSPDDRKLAFMSDRSGSLEIWTINPDGSSPEKLTDLGYCGSPRWSPDSRWIAFDAVLDGRTGVFVVAAKGGPVKMVVADGSENMVPSWSNDGKWIYFASNRSGDPQVWKVPVEGGPSVQVTRQGGFATAESFDGQTLYYAKTRFENPEVWEVSTDGGTERRVSPLLRPTTWANWALTQKGILFLNDQNDPGATLEFYDFATSGVRPVSELEKPSFWLAASRDAQSVWYSWKEDEVSRASLRIEFH